MAVRHHGVSEAAAYNGTLMLLCYTGCYAHTFSALSKQALSLDRCTWQAFNSSRCSFSSHCQNGALDGNPAISEPRNLDRGTVIASRARRLFSLVRKRVWSTVAVGIRFGASEIPGLELLSPKGHLGGGSKGALR